MGEGVVGLSRKAHSVPGRSQKSTKVIFLIGHLLVFFLNVHSMVDHICLTEHMVKCKTGGLDKGLIRIVLSPS